MARESDMKKKTASPSKWIVLKFGGTSVSSLKCWQTIAWTVEERLKNGLKPLVVCSAVTGVTNNLERLLSDAVQGKKSDAFEQIKKTHENLAGELGVSSNEIKGEIEELNRLTTGASLIREISPRIRAQILSLGELMSTRLGAAFLKKRGISIAWHDARDLLTADTPHTAGDRRHYLHATCSYEPDEGLRKRLDKLPAKAIITQGFIAGDSNKDTVLLGRGGSDTSASYLASKLSASVCEIWTDVPGMYTANPRQIPSARLLKSLDYDEALEIASSGAKVLHPRCLPPLSRYSIPLQIRCIDHPLLKGTEISKEAHKTGAQVKAISEKKGITLISMDTVDMWHQPGFLANVFDCFRRHGFSIDLVSTSETNVTVTLDQTANTLDPEMIKNVVCDLENFCRTQVIDSLALVSLVGKNIRSILPHLGNALEIFEEQKIYLVSQAANDLNLTFVVDEEQSDRLVRELHSQIFDQRKNDFLLGPTWKELKAKTSGEGPPADKPWWIKRKDELIRLARNKTPLYVYNEDTIDESISKLSKIKSVEKIFYSVKANANEEVLKKIYESGLGFECVSINELSRVTDLFPCIDRRRLLFTPNFAARSEYERAFEIGSAVTLDNLYPLENWPGLFRDKEIFVRMDPARGKGHHKYVHTAGTKTKFGIPFSQLEKLAELTKKNNVRVIGLHAHVGSNIFSPETWSEVALFLIKVADKFPRVSVLDLGGGLGVVEKPAQEPLDLNILNLNLAKVKRAYPQYELWIEPGRFIVAEAGILLTRVTQTKNKGDYNYIGIDAGMNTLIRPALYGSYHDIVNLTRIDKDADTIANIVGPICESGDVLGHSRHITSPQEGDVILIATVGAYGRVMSSMYNLREPAAEYFLKSQKKGLF
jgi:diaminopimelate decarboxylase/aspartate kinase